MWKYFARKQLLLELLAIAQIRKLSIIVQSLNQSNHEIRVHNVVHRALILLKTALIRINWISPISSVFAQVQVLKLIISISETALLILLIFTETSANERSFAWDLFRTPLCMWTTWLNGLGELTELNGSGKLTAFSVIIKSSNYNKIVDTLANWPTASWTWRAA